MSGNQQAIYAPTLDVGGSASAIPKRWSKDRSQFLRVLEKCIACTAIDVNDRVLVVGGTQEDAWTLRRCGFSRITLSNIHGALNGPNDPDALPVIAVDAEDIRLPDDSYEVIFFHEVIHHCRSPHRALCEMLRVARRQVLMMEPNDSFLMRLICRLRFSFPFEIFAVVNNDFVRGGVRNSAVPNFIFRWNAHEVRQLVSAFLPEYKLNTYADPYWDFNVNEKNLADRKQTKIGLITGVIGAGNFLRILHGIQRTLNKIPFLRRQGNKFFCCVQKNSELQPWLKLDSDGTVIFDRSYQRKQEAEDSRQDRDERVRGQMDHESVVQQRGRLP
jgi:SAM-dependent methyltransferase